MIEHFRQCGQPSVDDGRPNTFAFDENCATCRAIRDSIMWGQASHLLDEPTQAERVEREIRIITGRDLAGMITRG